MAPLQVVPLLLGGRSTTAPGRQRPGDTSDPRQKPKGRGKPPGPPTGIHGTEGRGGDGAGVGERACASPARVPPQQPSGGKSGRLSGGASSSPIAQVQQNQAAAPVLAREYAAQEYTKISSTNLLQGKFLLPPVRHQDVHKICLIIDLDETLVHSSFKPISNADFVVPVEIDGTVHQVYVLKRPYVDEFLQRVGDAYECVLFTASLAKYADPVADLLDKWGVFRARLFRESCVFYRGNYVKSGGLFTLALGRRVCRAGKLSGTVCGAPDREGTPHAAGTQLSPQPAARAAPAKLGKALERDGGRHFPGHVRGTGQASVHVAGRRKQAFARELFDSRPPCVSRTV
ncbi:hypothetical protein HPB48_003858 [Haemaphysalis longicornis]|uniref:Mitochondrial import inner membrane translocase subunit TIM50 n=1 Tax=Haemaphysalis longicornis TaxID=44386 RepID=A0A9J6FLB8_HAELO|nr:hypothetical protein HPB48_003858 [Haemaphysalis longicornis]